MIRHIALDAGGVMVYPRLGDWNLPCAAPAILGAHARDLATSKYLMAHRQAAAWLDESRVMRSLEDERHVRREYIRQMNELMGWSLTRDEINRLGDDFTENPQRYGLYNDVLPWLKRWRETCTISVLSDCMPSLPVYLRRAGLLECMSAGIYSFRVGAIKPDPRMYQALLSELDAKPEECLFIDDRVSNLTGAKALGIHTAQMVRRELPPAEIWDGPVVHTFEEINRHIEALNRTTAVN